MRIHPKLDRIICGLVQNLTCAEDEAALSDWIYAGKPVVEEIPFDMNLNLCREALAASLKDHETKNARIKELEAQVRGKGYEELISLSAAGIKLIRNEALEEAAQMAMSWAQFSLAESIRNLKK